VITPVVDYLRSRWDVDPRRIVPAFGRPEWIAHWQKHVTSREIVSSTPIEL